MNFKFIDNIRKKGAEKKEALDQKKDLQSQKAANQDKIQQMMAEGKQDSKEFQQLVNESKTLDTKAFNKGVEASQKQGEIVNTKQQLANERGQKIGEGLKQSASAPLSAEHTEKIPDHHANPIPMRKGNSVHQFETPYPNSKEPKLNEGLAKDNAQYPDWNPKHQDSQKKNNLAAVNETNQATKKQAQQAAQGIQKAQTKEQDNER